MRHLSIQRDPAEPPPGDRIAHLGAQALITSRYRNFEAVGGTFEVTSPADGGTTLLIEIAVWEAGDDPGTP
jgi:hypothetical protein